MIRIDPEFEKLIPPLSAEEFAQLEENILREGIRDPLVVWRLPNGDQILVDGHNRMKISAKHGGIPFSVREMEFDLRNDAEEWILRNQLGRRNVDKWVRLGMAKRLEDIEKQKGRKRMSDGGKGKEIFPDLKGQARDAMGKMVGVSGKTYEKMKAIDASDNEEVKAAAKSGDISVNAAYQKLKAEKERAEAENAELKKIVVELKDRPPEIREVTKEVVPEDYRQTKADLAAANRNYERVEREFNAMRKKYEDAREQVNSLSEKLGESTETAKAERDIQYFTTATNDYIRRYGGHVWAFNEMQNVSEQIRIDYVKALRALDAFAQQMISNIEGGIL